MQFNEAIAILMRWLDANSHALVDCNWYARSMGRVADRICEQALLLKENPMLITNEEFIMDDELPPFVAFNECNHGKKTQHRVARNAKKCLSNKELLDEASHPKNPVSIEKYFLMEECGEKLVDSLISELTDQRKDVHDHFSAIGGKFSWESCT